MKSPNSSGTRPDSPLLSNEPTQPPSSSTQQLANHRSNGEAFTTNSTISTLFNSIDSSNTVGSGLARSRKRARSETKRPRQFASIGNSNRSGKNGATAQPLSLDVEADDDEMIDGINDVDDERGFSPLDGHETPLRGRARRQTYQFPPDRRDSSLGGYGHHTLYGGIGTLPRRARPEANLTRATTIGAGDPLSILRSASQIPLSLRNTVIPPPPSEPPPAAPLSGSFIDFNSRLQNNPYGLLSHHNAQQQQSPAAIHPGYLAAVNSQLMSPLSNPNALQNPYVLNAHPDMVQLHLQLRQQQQQQQAALALLQQQQLIQNSFVNPALFPGSPLQNSQYGLVGTLGRDRRLDSTPADYAPSYMSTNALLAASAAASVSSTPGTQQPSSIYQTHHRPTVEKLESSEQHTVHSLLMHQSSSDGTSGPTGCVPAGGSGSVVYENSCNSFHRSLSNPVPATSNLTDSKQNPSISNGFLLPGVNGSQTAVNPLLIRGHNDHPQLAHVPTALPQSPHIPPIPPPNHPSMDLAPIVAARQLDPTYGSYMGGYQKSSGQSVDTPTALHQSVKEGKRRWCPWYAWVIGVLVLAFLLALILALSFSVDERLHSGSNSAERYSQDASIFGLFDPNNPPIKLEPNRPVHIKLASLGVWSGEWLMRTARYIQCNITVHSELTVIGLFLRRNSMPTLVRYDRMDRIVGRTLTPTGTNAKVTVGSRTKRAASTTGVGNKDKNGRTTARVHYLEEGRWFISLVNDKPVEESVVFFIADAEMGTGCPNDCTNRGICSRGNCDCVNGFTGPDCSIAKEPEICSGHGYFMAGSCRCYPEWKGFECQVLWSECIDPTCSSNGQCVTGECQCYSGFAGESCELRLCGTTNCTGNGLCVEGKCRCFSGWSGASCDVSVPVMHTAGFQTPSASDAHVLNQKFDMSGPRQRMSNPDGSSPALLDAQIPPTCLLDCGSHGRCGLNKADRTLCECDLGWGGDRCDRRLCDPRCFKHGRCANGTCVCEFGWDGKHCTLDACPLGCNTNTSQGRCILSATTTHQSVSPHKHYSCQCSAGWKGSACQTKVEIECDDGVDNDQDGLVDCLDPDCCPSSHCRQLVKSTNPKLAVEEVEQSCAHSKPFHLRLLITPMAQPGSTFYGQLEFLRRDGIAMDNFDPRRISVIRGTVYQSDGTTFWGVRVSDRRKFHNGFTITDEFGRFDLRVDGGSIVTLEFLRYPTDRFSATHHIYTPVNEIVILGDFYLHDALQTTHDDFSTGGRLAPTPVMHDFWLWKLRQIGNKAHSICAATQVHPLFDTDALYVEIGHVNQPETQMHCLDDAETLCVSDASVIYSIPLRDSGLKLIYRSNQAVGYHPAVRVHLINGPTVPEYLREIHLIFDVYGLRQIRRLEPDLNMVQTFYWNRTDGYNRTVHGVAHAKISAGFVYEGCDRVFWEHRTVQIPGQELSNGDFSNWNLNILHFYSVNHGIVYRGDGHHLFLKHLDWQLIPILGSISADGSISSASQRPRREPGECPQCASGQLVSSPVRHLNNLLVDTVGDVLVGDGAFLRWLKPAVFDNDEKKSFASETLDARAQHTFHVNDRRLWLAYKYAELNQFVDEFVIPETNQPDPQSYHLSAHPNFILTDSALDLPGSSNCIASGFFLSHEQTIWWMADLQHPQPLVSPDCIEQKAYPALIGFQCVRHPLRAPKGTVTTSNALYFIDSQAIWRISMCTGPNGEAPIVQRSVGGTLGSSSNPRLPCNHSIPSSQVHLRSPSHLVYSPQEDVIYYADGKQVFRLHIDSQMVSVVVGFMEDGCPHRSHSILGLVELSEIRGLAVSPEGDLYVAESHRIWVRRADGLLYPISGHVKEEGRTNLPTPDQNKGRSPVDSSSTVDPLRMDLGLVELFRFGDINSISVSIYGELFVADRGHGVVYRIHYSLPTLSESSNQYRVLVPRTDESYVFNSHGYLMQTDNAVFQNTLHQFDYRSFAMFRWLSEVRGNNINFRFFTERNKRGSPVQLKTSTGLFYNITLDSGSRPRIESVGDPLSGSSWHFRYSSSGLLTHLIQPDHSGPIRFEYNDESGRLHAIHFPDSTFLDSSSWVRGLRNRSEVRGDQQQTSVSSYSYGYMTHKTYDSPTNPWTVRFSQSYQMHPNHGRPMQVRRQITIPSHVGSDDQLDNILLWTFDSYARQSTAPIQRRNSYDGRAERQVLNIPGHVAANDWQLGKTLSVNGQPVLTVNFDWARQLETYQRGLTDQVLLQIVYNANFQPMIINASVPLPLPTSQHHISSTASDLNEQVHAFAGPAPLRLTYTSDGRLSTLDWSSTHYRFVYDPLQRLKSAELGDSMESISYEYTHPHAWFKPTILNVSGLGQFRFIYSDPTSSSSKADYTGLTQLITPSGLVRKFHQLSGLAVYQFHYAPWPHSPGFWIYEWADDLEVTQSRWSTLIPRSNQLLRFIWPSTRRRITHLPDQQRLVYDQTTIRWNWQGLYPNQIASADPFSSAPWVQITDILSGYRSTLWRTFRGPLVKKVRWYQSIPSVRSAHPQLDGGLIHARFSYEYNDQLNLKQIHTQFYAQSPIADQISAIPRDLLLFDDRLVMTYDQMTGHCLSMNDLDIVQRPSALYVTYALKGLQLYKQFDERGRLKQTILYPLSTRRDPLYNLTLIYQSKSSDTIQQREEQRGHLPRFISFIHGPGSRIEVVQREVAGSLRSHTSLIYNSEGRIARLRLSMSDHVEDSELGSTRRSEELQFVYDKRGLLQSRGNWQFIFDEDGFLTERQWERTRDRFAYNSKGLLIWAERTVEPLASSSPGPSVGTGPLTPSAFDQVPIEDDIGARRSFRMQYLYDAQDRLVLLRDTLVVRDLVQYFYANPQYPHQLTHLFNHGTLTTIRFHYEPVQGHLMAMEEFTLPAGSELTTGVINESSFYNYDGRPPQLAVGEQKQLYFVITNQDGSPTAIISQDGKTTWIADYSATGGRRLHSSSRSPFYHNKAISSLFHDSNIPIGFLGCLTDVHTGFLFCPPTMRAYDPLGASFTSPDWRGLVTSRLRKIYRDPTVLDTHKWSLSDQQGQHGNVDGLDGFDKALRYPQWWLVRAGLNVQSMLDNIDPCRMTDNDKSCATTSAYLPRLPSWAGLTAAPMIQTSSAWDLNTLLNHKIQQLSLTRQSPMSSGSGLPGPLFTQAGDDDWISLAPADHMFNSQLSFKLDGRGFVEVLADSVDSEHKSDNPFESTRLPNILLTGARLLDWWTDLSMPSSPLLVHSFGRLGHVRVTLNELSELGLKLPLVHSPTGHKMTLYTTETHHEIWLTNNPIQWRIRFVGSWEVAYAQILREALLRGQDLAWTHETELARRLSPTDHQVMRLLDRRVVENSVTKQLLGLRHLWTYKELAQLNYQTQLTGFQWVPAVQLVGNGSTALARLYNNPGIYQLRSIKTTRIS